MVLGGEGKVMWCWQVGGRRPSCGRCARPQAVPGKVDGEASEVWSGMVERGRVEAGGGIRR